MVNPKGQVGTLAFPQHSRGKLGGGKGKVVGPFGESGPDPTLSEWNPPRAFARDGARSFVEAISLETDFHAAIDQQARERRIDSTSALSRGGEKKREI